MFIAGFGSPKYGTYSDVNVIEAKQVENIVNIYIHRLQRYRVRQTKSIREKT